MCTSSIIPTRFLIASPCQLPASRPAPSVQARKGAGRGKNPFLFAMLFEKNIESFSERQPVGVMSFLLLPPAFPSLDGGGWYSGGASRCRAAEHHWIFGDSDDNRARAGHGMFCAASSNPRSIPVGYGLTDGCISDGYHSDCSSCKRDLWTLDNRHARVSRPPCDHISWPPSLSRKTEIKDYGHGNVDRAVFGGSGDGM